MTLKFVSSAQKPALNSSLNSNHCLDIATCLSNRSLKLNTSGLSSRDPLSAPPPPTPWLMVTPFSQLLRPNTWAPLFSSQRTWDQPANPVCSSFRVRSEPDRFFHYSHPAPSPQPLGLGHYPGNIPASRPSWTSLVYFQQCPEWASHKTGHVFPRLRNLRHLRSHSQERPAPSVTPECVVSSPLTLHVSALTVSAFPVPVSSLSYKHTRQASAWILGPCSSLPETFSPRKASLHLHVSTHCSEMPPPSLATLWVPLSCFLFLPGAYHYLTYPLFDFLNVLFDSLIKYKFHEGGIFFWFLPSWVPEPRAHEQDTINICGVNDLEPEERYQRA